MWERWGHQTPKHLKYSLNGLARFQLLPKFNFSTTLRQIFMNHLYHIICMPPNPRNLRLSDFLGLFPRCMNFWQREFSSHCSKRSSLQPHIHMPPKHGFGFATSILLESQTLSIFSSCQNLSQPLIPSWVYLVLRSFSWTLLPSGNS